MTAELETPGVRTVVGYCDGGGDLFGVTYLPDGAPLGAVLMCSPLYAELLKNNRREVVLGRTLAARGWIVQRFHYRGTGNSGGADEAVSLDSLRDDALEAAGHLAGLAGEVPLTVVGTRLGGFPAVEAAGLLGAARLLLWAPSLSGDRFLDELMRYLRMPHIGRGEGSHLPRTDPRAKLARGDVVDAFGFGVHAALADSLTGRRLVDGLGAAPAEVGVLDLGRRPTPSAALEALADAWRARGHTVDVRMIPHEEAWWFHDDVFRSEEARALNRLLVAESVAWICKTAAPSAVAV